MATAADLGDPSSPLGDKYPRTKQPLAKRIAACAARLLYQRKDAPFQGPQPVSAAVSAASGLVSVAYDPASVAAGMNLVAAEACPLAGSCATWQLVGPGGQLAVPSDVQIVGNTVTLAGPFGKQTVAVRYGLADWPLLTLYSSQGFPATPMNISITSVH